MLKDTSHALSIIRHQKPHEDIFITKYPINEEINTVILDFDGADDKEKVLAEALTIKRFLERKGLNTVIVSSTNKGYHVYIQTPTLRLMDISGKYERRERNRLFVLFTENLIRQQHFRFSSLDPANTHAGLGGNIRLVGSTHPKTLQTVEIVDGEFINMSDRDICDDYIKSSGHYVNTIYKSTLKEFELKKEMAEKRINENLKRREKEKWDDPIKTNDLRQTIPNLYGGQVKRYNGYIFMQCPWHTDRKPSLMVTKEWFYCTGCGKKGNIWTLIKNGEIKL